MMRSKGKHVVGKLLLVIATAAVLGSLVMLLWNAVVPTAFTGARALDYPHALGLLVLSRILFGGFGGRFGAWRRGGHRMAAWRAMTPEERQLFKANMRSRQRP